MNRKHKPGPLFIAVFFLIIGQFNSTAQTDFQNPNLTDIVQQQISIVDGVHSQSTIEPVQVNNTEEALLYQHLIEIDLSISAAALYNHALPGHLSIRDLAHCFMKDNNLGKAKNYGFFLFNIFQAINHVRDFTSFVRIPTGDTTKTVKWEISSLDSGFDCELVKLEPLGKSKRKGVFNSLNLSGDKKSIEIEITPDTEPGNYRYAIHFKVNDRIYIIDPRLKIQR